MASQLAKNRVELYNASPAQQNSAFCEDRIFVKAWLIIAHIYTTRANSGGCRTHDLCDTGVVLYQLSYQANRELVTLWVRNTSVSSSQLACLHIFLRSSNMWSFIYWLASTGLFFMGVASCASKTQVQWKFTCPATPRNLKYYLLSHLNTLFFYKNV